MSKYTFILIVVSFLITTYRPDVHAARMGNSKSIGKQSSQVSKQKLAPLVQNATAVKPQNAPVSTVPSVSPPVSRPWGSMLGGMAAGLGLAWLANSLGLIEVFGNILLSLLIGVIVLSAIGWVIRYRQNKEQYQSNVEIHKQNNLQEKND